MLISCPLYIQASKKKKFYLNLNVYRNAPFHLLNAVKIAFKETLQDQLTLLPRYRKIELVFTVYPSTLRDFDISNICSVVDKFFSDALVEFGKLPDDNFKHLLSVKYCYGQLDRVNPRVDVEIIPLEYEQEEDMKIILEQHEIFQAMAAYVRANMPTLAGPDQKIEFDMTGGRGQAPYEATVTVGAPGSLDQPSAAPSATASHTASSPVTPVTKPAADPAPKANRAITDTPETREDGPSLLKAEPEAPKETPAPMVPTGGLFGKKPEATSGDTPATGAAASADANASSPVGGANDKPAAEPTSIFSFGKSS